MEIKLNTSSVGNLASVSEAIKDPAAVAAETSPILSANNVNVVNANVDLESLLASLMLETNEAKLNAARARLVSALEQLTDLSEEESAKFEEVKAAGLDFKKAEERSKAAEAKLDAAKAALADYKNKGGTDPARIKQLEDAVASAAAGYKEAKSAAESAGTKFDRLLESLDAASLTALREAVTLLASDIDYLHSEIEEDDKKHVIGVILDVGDVISEALDRISEKMSDEVEDRNLKHV